MSNDLQGFDVGEEWDATETTKRALLLFIKDVIPNLDEMQFATLLDHVPPEHMPDLTGGEGGIYDADFDMNKEIGEQIISVRAMRNSIMVHGRIKPNISTREVKEVVASANTMFTTLMKHHETVQGLERHRAVESATVEILKEMDPISADKFFAELERRLEAIE